MSKGVSLPYDCTIIPACVWLSSAHPLGLKCSMQKPHAWTDGPGLPAETVLVV
jgi:hypothetical protein